MVELEKKLEHAQKLIDALSVELSQMSLRHKNEPTKTPQKWIEKAEKNIKSNNYY